MEHMASAEDSKHDTIQTGKNDKGCFNPNYEANLIYSDSMQIWYIYGKDPSKLRSTNGICAWPS